MHIYMYINIYIYTHKYLYIRIYICTHEMTNQYLFYRSRIVYIGLF